ncbi:AT-rich interactive domain-containing protein 5B [Bagarius yarrelli]|uniref:AT-rich interactive domain-containing protein 5B n=1 Tax=Bagarius yarrelli TaxID=175774 RepID=A0A556TIK1_BAGYA|nr:AT-rich interactive domain-containing protein 5B [Bagarius yarrelli]
MSTCLTPSLLPEQDEVIAVSEKVIVKLEDLVKWTVWNSSCWKKGLHALPLKPSMLKELGKNGQKENLYRYRESTLNSGLNFKDVLREKAELGDDGEDKKVLVLSYPQYCRYRSIIARLREKPASLLADQVVLALGGIATLTSNTQILYCRDTFEHPTLLENDSICDEFDPWHSRGPSNGFEKVPVRQRAAASVESVNRAKAPRRQAEANLVDAPQQGLTSTLMGHMTPDDSPYNYSCHILLRLWNTDQANSNNCPSFWTNKSKKTLFHEGQCF